MAAITVSFNKKESVSSMPEDSSDGVIYNELIEVNIFKYGENSTEINLYNIV